MNAIIGYVNKHISIKLREGYDFVEALEKAREEIRKEDETINKSMEG